MLNITSFKLMSKKQKKCIPKRILSIFLVMSLTITTVLKTTSITVEAADAGELINKPLKLPVSVYSEDRYTGSNVLKNLKANNDSPYDVKKYFKAYYCTSNMSGYSGKALGSSIACSSNDYFDVRYSFNPPDEMKNAWRKGDYSVAVMYDSYKYKKTKTSGVKKTTYTYWTIVDYKNNLRSVSSNGEHDKNNAWTTHGINKSTGELTWLRGGPGTYVYNSITFVGSRSNTSFANIGVQIMDTIGPSVVGAYVLKGTGNPDKPYSYEYKYDEKNFPQGSTAYIAVEFDEPVKIKQGTDLSTLKLNLNTISNIDNTSKEQKADFFALNCEDGGLGKRIVFKYTVPEGVDLRLSDLDIEGSNFVTGKTVLDLPGNEVGRNTYAVKSNKVKDLYSGRGKTVYFDSIDPTINSTNLTVSTSREIITNGSSDISLYYTAGDELTFDVLFSETLDSTKFNLDDLKLIVNIGNDGPSEKTRTLSNPIFIKENRISSNARPGSVLRYKYVIKEGDDTHQPVKAIKLIAGNSSKIVDLRQNMLNDYTNFKTPAQRIYIDTVKPTVIVEKYEYDPDEIPPGSDPNLYGCYKLTFNDDYSSTDGIEAHVKLWYYNNESDKSAGYAIDYLIRSDSPAFPADVKGMVYTGDTIKIPEIPTIPYYVHYKLPDNVECQNVELNVWVYDLAGNIDMPVLNNSVIIDKTKPAIKIEDRTAYSMVEPFPENFDAYVTIEDNSSNIKNYTQWTETGTAYDNSNWVKVLDYLDPTSTKAFAARCDIEDDVNNKTLWVKSVDDKENSSIESHQFVYDARTVHYNLAFNDSPSKILTDHNISLKVAEDTEFYYQWVKKGQAPVEGNYIKVSASTTALEELEPVPDVAEVKIGDNLGLTGIYELCYKAKNIDSGLESQVIKTEFSFSNIRLGDDGEINVFGNENFWIYEGANDGLPDFSEIKRTFDDVYFMLQINDKNFGGNKTVDYDSTETYYKAVDGSGQEIFKKPLPPQDTAYLTFPSSVFEKTGMDYKAIISVKSVGSQVPYTTEFPVAIEKNTFAVGGLVGISGNSDTEKQSIPVEDAGSPLYTNATGEVYLNFQAVSDQTEVFSYSYNNWVRCSLTPNYLSSEPCDLPEAKWYKMSSQPAGEDGRVIYKNSESIMLDLPVGDTVVYYQFKTQGGYVTEVRSTTVHADKTAPDGELIFDFGDANKDNAFPAIKREVTEDTGSLKSIKYGMEDSDEFVNNSPVTVRLQNISDNLSDAAELTVSASAYTKGQNIYIYNEAQNNLEISHSLEDEEILPNADGSYTFNKEGYYRFIITDQSGNITEISGDINWIHTKAVEIYDGPEAGYYTYDTFDDFENVDMDTFKKGLSAVPEGNFGITAVVGDYAAEAGVSYKSVSDVYFAFNKEYQSRLINNSGILDDDGLVWYKAGDSAFGMISTYKHKDIIVSDEDKLGQYFTLKSQCQYDPSIPEGDIMPITVYVKAKDIAGHETEVKEVKITPENVKPAIAEHYYSPTDGYVIKFNVPVTLTDLSSDKKGSSSMVHKNVPIYYNGGHKIKFKDVFGNGYEEIVTAVVFDDMYNHTVTVTPDTPTNTSVTVTLSTKNNEGLYIDADTISGGEAAVSGAGTVSGIEGNVCTGAVITMTGNGNVSYTLKSTKTGVADNTFTIPVNNIDTILPTADVEYVYFAPVEDGVTSGKVVAQLTNESEPITMLNGDMNYTFSKGGKGDTYTFEFKDNAGNIGTAVAILPVDIAFPDALDTTLPDYSLKFMSQNIYGINMMDDYSGEQYRNDTAEGKFSLHPTNGKLLIDILPIDETEVTLTLKEPADGVTLSGSRLTFSSDSSCSVVLTDAKNNTTTVSITVDKVIDNEAPTAKFGYAANDQNIRAYITVYDNLSKSEDITIVKNTGVEYDSSRNQYYYEFDKNGIYTFVIEDQAGNIARPQAVVGGIDNTPLTAELLKWIPSLNEDYPKEQYDKITNKSVKVLYKLSKPIKKVEVAPASAYDKVNVAFSADTLITEFKENAKVTLNIYDYSDNTFTIDVPEVTNIDKKVPKINVSLVPETGRTKQVKAVFTSDKPVILTSEAVKEDTDSEPVYKTAFEKIINQNGSYVSTFVDEAGNMAVVEYNVSNINTAPSNIYVLGVPSPGALATNSDINLQIVSTHNGTVYFDNKAYNIQGTDASVKDNKVVVGDMSKALPVTVSINGRYDITVVDEFLNRKSTYFNIINIDKAPPRISLMSLKMLTVEIGTTLAEFETAVRQGVTAFDKFDNKDLTSQILIEGITEDNLNKEGVYSINYKVCDSAGNIAVSSRRVYVSDPESMVIKINGVVMAQYNTAVVNTRQISVSTNIKGPEFKMYYKKGYNTIGEMKDSEVFDNSFTAQSSGYYTIVVKTQEKVYGIYYIYVDAI